MIHCTTYKSPNGSILGALIEARDGDSVKYAANFDRSQAHGAPLYASHLMDEHSPLYQGMTGVVYKQQTVSLREWYGINQ